VAYIEALVVLIFAIASNIVATGKRLVFLVGGSARTLSALPLCIGTLWRLIIQIVSQLLLWERQVVEACRVSIHVLDFNLEHAYDYEVVFNLRDRFLASDFFNRLSNNVLGRVVVEHFAVRAHH